MSRRFGRNQKRHMREQIAQAEQRAASILSVAEQCREELKNRGALLRETSDQLRVHKEFFSEIAGKVGKHAIIAGLSPRFMQSMPTTPQWRMAVPQPVPAFPSFANASMVDRMTIRAEVMELLEVDAVRDRFTDKLHVRGALADGRVGYSISRAALHGMTLDELIRQITPELARSLAEAIQRSGR